MASQRRPYWIVLGVLAAVHLLLLLLVDFSGDAGFMRADRATQRFGSMSAVMQSLEANQAITPALVRNGNIGDYGAHLVLYRAGGHVAVTVVQTVLGLLASLCVVYIAFAAGSSRGVALAAGLLYGLLPQSLAFPHQLLSEAFSNPLLIMGSAGVIWAMHDPRRWSRWALAGLCMGLAGLVRPSLLPLPLVVGAVVLMLSRRMPRPADALFVAVAYAPYVLWGAFMLTHSGRFGLGNSHQDLGINFSQSVEKVLLSKGVSGPEATAPDWLPERLGLGEYAGYVMRHPLGFANLYAKNTLVLLADSGVGRLYVDLLGFGSEAREALRDPVTGWRAQLTNHGPVAMVVNGLRTAPGPIIAGLVGVAGFALINLGLLAGYVSLLRRSSPVRTSYAPLIQRITLVVLLMLPVYVLATSQVVAYAPSRLRSPAEFAWTFVSCIGWVAMWSAWKARRNRRA